MTKLTPEDPRIAELEEVERALKSSGKVNLALMEAVDGLRSERDQLAAKVVELRGLLAEADKRIVWEAEGLGNDFAEDVDAALASTASPAPQAIERIRQEARREEREACAKTADDLALDYMGTAEEHVHDSDEWEKAAASCQEVAAAIRSRTNGGE